MINFRKAVHNKIENGGVAENRTRVQTRKLINFYMLSF